MDLLKQHCQHYEKGTPPLSREATDALLEQTPDWHLGDNFLEISREFRFKNYYETISFVNAVAWIYHQEDHHPDMTVHYNRCHITFSTHSVGGLSDNDFICAAKTDALIDKLSES